MSENVTMVHADSTESVISSRRTTGILVWMLGIILVVVLLRNAWVNDDAYISFRTVDNLVHGYGLRWNVDERVQGFTNPLWVLLMSVPYAITGEIYYTSIFVSIALVLLTVLLTIKHITRTDSAALFAVTALICSKAFIDYSTSGLEQPLLYLLCAIFIWHYLKFDGRIASFGKMALIAALSALTRMDTLLLYLPALLILFWQCRSWKAALYGIWGFAPFLVWEMFSLIYFGFPFPNTYYAKLHAGVPAGEMMKQGFMYCLETIQADPITLILISSAVVLAVFRKIRGLAAIGLGIALYCCYVIKSGGDFMSGRFFALPVLGAVIVLSRINWEGKQFIAGAAALLLLGFISPYPPLLSNSQFGTKENASINPTGITDERAWYYQHTGLLRTTRVTEMPDHPWADKGRKFAEDGDSLVRESCVGFTGFYAGPKVHIMDGFALTEPLLARLPTISGEKWRIGHLSRIVPFGYEKTLRTKSNQIPDSNLAKYYRKLCIITKDPIFSVARFRTIGAMNLGRYDYLLSGYWDSTAQVIPYKKFNTPIREGTVWNAPGNLILRRGGVDIVLDSVAHTKGVEVSLDHNDYYAAWFYDDTAELGRVEIGRRITKQGGMRNEIITVPNLAKRIGYNRIRISPVQGDDAYSIGHARLVDSVAKKE